MKILQKLSHYRFSRYFKLLFVLVDVVLLNLAIILSTLARFGSLDRLLSREERTVSLLSILIWVALLLQNDSNRSIRVEPIESILVRTIRKLLIHAALISIFVVYLNFYDISRLRLCSFYLIFFALLMVSRFVSMTLLKYIRAQGYNFKTFIIVGANESGEKIRKILAKDLTYGYKFLGFFDEKIDSELVNPNSVLGGFDEISEFVIDKKVDEMYVALHIDNIEIINKLIVICEQNMVRIKFIPDFQL